MSTPNTNEAECKTNYNSIAWNELIVPDIAAAARFYGDLFGWTTEVFPNAGKEYTMLKHGDRTFGGILPTPQPGIPPHWLNYVAVANLEETIARAASLGAKTCMGPMSIGDAGRIAVIQDPQGATIGLHEHPAK